jgi:predicted Rossmann fold nucleotide-binding protein DprA/Smf involved in DNA uptake
VLAEEGRQHGAAHGAMDEKCAKECALLLKDCAREVDSIQDRIAKLQVMINKEGADAESLAELKVLSKKLKESNDLLKALQKH